MSEPGKVMPIISKAYCSSSAVDLTVRQRPRVINGGGFIVMNSSQNNAVFMVEGCSSLGAKGQLRLKDGDGGPLLSITKKEGIVQSLSIRNRWDGYLIDCEGEKKFIFSLTDLKCPISKEIKIKIEQKGGTKGWHFQVNGSFVHRTCSIEDYRGNIIAQLGVKESNGRDWYNVMVQPGHDQAFVVAVLAVLDNIYGESTRC